MEMIYDFKLTSWHIMKIYSETVDKFLKFNIYINIQYM